MDFDKKRSYQQPQCSAKGSFRCDIKNGRRMIRGLGDQKMIAALDGSFAAVVGVGRRAFSLVATIRGLLIELSTGEAVERPNQQKDC